MQLGEQVLTHSEMRNVYNVNLQGLNAKENNLEVVEVKSSCAPMYRPNVPFKLLDFMNDLELADHYAENRELSINILVGLDAYWKFVKHGVIRFPVAQETIFGWIISGSWKGEFSNVTSHQLLCLNDLPDSTLCKFWNLNTIV
jgi:hypothetical protein